MAISQRASGIIARVEQLKNQAFDPATRQKNIASIKSFAYERPLFFFFIATHLLLSTTPILIFLSFATSTFLISLSAAILFSLFWVVGAFLILAATLFVSISVGMTIWAWGAGALTISKWAYSKFLAADHELSKKISSQTSKEDNHGGSESFGQVNGEVNNTQSQSNFGGQTLTSKRDDFGVDKKLTKRGDYGIGLDRKLVNEV